MTAANYQFRLFNSKTLELLHDVVDFQSVWWHRKELELGEFEIEFNMESVNLDAAVVEFDTLLFDVRRDTGSGLVPEFSGIVQEPQWNAITRMWKLGGYDLKWYLGGRETRPASTVGDVAETAMRSLVQTHLITPGSGRDLNTELDGIDFVLAPTGAPVGDIVNYTARDENLLTVLALLGRIGNVTHDVTIRRDGGGTYVGYQYAVSAPVDSTVEGSGNRVVFSTSWADVGEMTLDHNRRGVQNALNMLSTGSDASRQSTPVQDDDDIAMHYRREGHVDGRVQTGSALIDVGAMQIAYQIAAAKQCTVKPLITGPWLYRTDYDVGHDVTLDLREVNE